MRTHQPKKKAGVVPAFKKTFATLCSRFKKPNPEQKQQNPGLSSIARESYSVEGKSQQSYSSPSARNPMTFSAISNPHPPPSTNKAGITQYQIYDELFIQALQLEKREMEGRYQRLRGEFERVEKEFVEYSGVMRERVREYEMDLKILGKENEYYKVEIDYRRKMEGRREAGGVSVAVGEEGEGAVRCYGAQTDEGGEREGELNRRIEALAARVGELEGIKIYSEEAIERNRIEFLQREEMYKEKIGGLSHELGQLEASKLQCLEENMVLRMEVERLGKQRASVEGELLNYEGESVENREMEVGVEKQSQTEQEWNVDSRKQQILFQEAGIQTQDILSRQPQSNSVVPGGNQISVQACPHQETHSTQTFPQQPQIEQKWKQQSLKIHLVPASVQTDVLHHPSNPSPQIDLLKLQSQQKTHQLNQYKTSYQQLKAEKQNVQQQNRGLLFRVQQIQQQLIFKNEQMEGYRSEVEELLAQIHRMESQEYSHFPQANQQPQPEKPQQPQPHAASPAQLHELLLQNASLLDRLSALQDTTSLQKQSLLFRIQTLELQCQQYLSKIGAIEKNYDKIALELQRIQTSNEHHKEESQEFRMKMVDLEEQNDSQERYIEQLGRELSEKGREIMSLKGAECWECRDLRAELVALRKELAERRRELEFDEGCGGKGRERERERVGNNY